MNKTKSFNKTNNMKKINIIYKPIKIINNSKNAHIYKPYVTFFMNINKKIINKLKTIKLDNSCKNVKINMRSSFHISFRIFSIVCLYL